MTPLRQQREIDAAAAPFEDLCALDRRAFLRWVGAAAGAGLLPSGCGGAPPRLAPPPGLELRFLTPRGYAVLTAAAQRVVGPRGAALIEQRAVDPGAAVDRFLASAPALADPLSRALWVLEFGVFPLLGKWRPFSALGGEAQDAILAELMGSRLALKRMLFKGVKSLALFGFYADPAGHAAIGYPVGGGPGGAGVEDAMSYDLAPELTASFPPPGAHR